jgi:hypothetical protein
LTGRRTGRVIYLTEVDKMLERAKEATRCGKYTHVEYARFADDLVILMPILEAGHRAALQIGVSREKILQDEARLEIAVSEHIRSMPFVWISVDDPSGPDSVRGVIERNSIALLSNYRRPPLDPSRINKVTAGQSTTFAAASKELVEKLSLAAPAEASLRA